MNVKEDSNIAKKRNVIIYGFLQKRSKYIHLWKTRFFILTYNYLFAFTGVENDADCTMALDLNNITEVSEISSHNTNKKEFIIKTNTVEYFFRGENENMRTKWIEQINTARELKKKSKKL